MLQHDELREAAARTLLTSSRLREQRALLATLPIQSATGTLRRSIYDGHHAEDLPGELVRAEGDAPTADAAVNAAYDGLGATYEFYAKVFNRSSIDGKGMRLEATVHFGRKYQNAYWNGHEMVFGDGDGTVFRDFTGAIDVIGHELTHGVTAELSGLEYHKQPGALNESFSDVMGSLVKQYKLGQTAAQADWLIGEGILGPSIHGKALRSMKAPGTAYDDPRLGGRDPQPGDMQHYADLPDDEWDDFGGVHINSGIPNHAFYLVAASLGGYAHERAGAIWYETLGMLQPSSQFADCAALTQQVAKAHFGAAEVDAVRSAWQQVGVTPSSGPSFARAQAAPTRRAAASGDALETHLERLVTDLQALVNALREAKRC